LLVKSLNLKKYLLEIRVIVFFYLNNLKRLLFIEVFDNNIETSLSVCLFLFGQAFEDYGKYDIGSVVGILNPDFIQLEGDHFALKIQHKTQMVKIATSKDFATCQVDCKNGKKMQQCI